MSTKVKIGVSDAPREIDLEVDDAEAFMRDFESALGGSQRLWWVTDAAGNRHGLVVERVAYVEVAPERDRTVGFR